MALLSALVLDEEAGVAFTIDSLKALSEPKKVPKEVQLDIDFRESRVRTFPGTYRLTRRSDPSAE